MARSTSQSSGSVRSEILPDFPEKGTLFYNVLTKKYKELPIEKKNLKTENLIQDKKNKWWVITEGLTANSKKEGEEGWEDAPAVFYAKSLIGSNEVRFDDGIYDIKRIYLPPKKKESRLT